MANNSTCIRIRILINLAVNGTDLEKSVVVVVVFVVNKIVFAFLTDFPHY
jgi:hypothetical protein